jgi:HEAT repeat protein
LSRTVRAESFKEKHMRQATTWFAMGLLLLGVSATRALEPQQQARSAREFRKESIRKDVADLKDKDGDIRRKAAENLAFLASLDPQTKADVAAAASQALTDALKDKRGDVRAAVAWTLGEIGPEAKTAVSALIVALKHDQDARVTRAVIIALGRIGPNAKEATPALVEIVSNGGANEQDTWEALGQIGPEAGEAVPELIKIFEAATRNPNRQRRVAEVMGKIGDDKAIQWLIRLTKDRNKFGLVGLTESGSKAEPAVPVLIDILKAGNKEKGDEGEELVWFRIAALGVLKKIGPDAKDAVPVLVEIVQGTQGESSTLPHFAAEVLGAIGPTAKAAVPALSEAYDTEDTVLKQSIGKALKQIDPEAAKKAGVR